MNAYMNKNGVKLLAMVAVLAMVVCAFAAIMPATESDAATNEPTYIHGGITSEQSFGDGTEVIIDGNLTIPEKTGLTIAGDFTVNEGVTVTIQAGGYLIFESTANATIDGNIVATGKNPLNPTSVSTPAAEDTYYPSIINKVAENTKDNYFTVNGSITLERGAIMSNDAAAVTAGSSDSTDSGNGMIVLTNGASLNVTKRTNDISVIENQNILLNEGATFTLNGQVGNVYVQSTGNASYRTEAAVSLNAGGLIDYTDAERTTSNLKFTVTNESISAVATNNDDQRYTVRQYILNVDGEVAAGDTLSTVNGTGTVIKSGSYNPITTTENPTGACQYFNPVKNENSNANLILPKVSVTGNLTVASDSKVTVATSTYLDVSGTVQLSYSSTDKEAATAELNGAIHVTGTIIGTFLNGNITANPTAGSDIIYVEDGSIQLTVSSSMSSFAPHVWGTMYTVEGATSNDDPTAYIMNFADAIAAATEANVETVYVYAYGAQNRTTADYAAANGAYVIETEITIPADMEINIENALIVGEKGVLILEEGAIVNISKTTSNKAILWNNGKVIDYGGAMEDYEKVTESFDPDFASGPTAAYDRFLFSYEVKKTTDTDTEYYVTYTTLAIAISESQAGDSIELNGKVTITEDLTIPTDVTVITDEDIASGNEALEINGATLTINGTLEIATAGQLVAVTDDEENNSEGAVVLNNIIANADENTFTDGESGDYTVAGAYFNAKIGDDETATDYITTVAIAAENSANIEGTDGITIRGTVTAGTVTFTEGENVDLVVTVEGTVSSGDVTLVGADLLVNGTFSGTITSEVTSGTSTMEFVKASGIKVAIASNDDGETVTTSMEFSGTTLKGTAAVVAGEVVLDGTMTVGTYTAGSPGVSADYAVLTIDSGATLTVPKDSTLIVASYASTVKDYAGLVVDGTLSIDEGTLQITASGTNLDAGQADVNGTLTIDGNDQSLAGIINVTGDVTVVDGYKLTVYRMYVGDDEGAAGSVTGSVDLDSTNNGVIYVYPAADMANAKISVTPEGTVLANETVFYINGTEYMTSYALDGTTFGTIMTEPVSLVGYKDVPTDAWYTTEDMTGDAIESGDQINDITAAYAKADPRTVNVQVSVGQGISVYIDNVRYSNGQIAENITVGDHTVTTQVNPGYTGTTSVLFNGVEVTGESFTVTAEMAGTSDTVPTIVLSVTGDIAVDTGSSSSGSSDDGLGLTDYLLIILVILIVVMAIMVAMRLMRS